MYVFKYNGVLKMSNEKTRGYTVRFRPSVMDKVHKYMEISNISKTKFFDELLEEFFNNKILERGFLELEMPYYVNTDELVKKRAVNATTEKPASNLKNQIIIFKVPTNLDSWNSRYGTFCSEYPNHHEGIKPIVALFSQEDGMETIKILYHVFKFTYPHGDEIKETSLEISILSPDEVEIFLNQYPEEIVEDLLIEFKQFEKDVSEDLISGLTPFEIFKKYDDPSFTRMLHFNQNINDMVNLFSSIANNLFDVMVKSSIEANTISKDLTKDLEEKGRDNFTLEDVENYEDKIIKNKTAFLDGIKNLDSNLEGRDSKTFEKLRRILEENPDNPIFNMLDKTIEQLTEFNNLDDPVPTDDVYKTIYDNFIDETLNIKEDSHLEPDFVLGLFDGTDINKNVLELFSIMANAKSKEEYIEDVNILTDKLNL